MKFITKTLPFAALLLLAMNVDAGASSTVAPQREDALPAPAPLARETGLTMAPFAFVKFCMENGDQCEGGGPEQVVTLTPDAWNQIVLVNDAINRRIRPDASKGGYDWSLETRFGNCNDYAIQKRRALIELGLPASALSLSVVIAQGVGHLVLTVRTDRGDFVLDNLKSTIVAWNQTGYHWVKRQSAADPKIWVNVAPARQGMQVAQRKPADSGKMAVARNAERPAPRPSSSALVLAELALPIAAEPVAPVELRGSIIAEPLVGDAIAF